MEPSWVFITKGQIHLQWGKGRHVYVLCSGQTQVHYCISNPALWKGCSRDSPPYPPPRLCSKPFPIDSPLRRREDWASRMKKRSVNCIVHVSKDCSELQGRLSNLVWFKVVFSSFLSSSFHVSGPNFNVRFKDACGQKDGWQIIYILLVVQYGFFTSGDCFPLFHRSFNQETDMYCMW